MHFHEFMIDVHQRLHALHEQQPKRLAKTERGLPVYRYAAREGVADPVHQVGENIASEVKLLCLDEVQVHDVADALLLRRLFEPILQPRPQRSREIEEHTANSCSGHESQQDACATARTAGETSTGCVVVWTSNTAPQELYHQGLNRKYFLPFVDLLRECSQVVHVGSPVDYRTRVGRHTAVPP